MSNMRIGYADPPYPGQSKKHYEKHPDYAGEVDHADLLRRLERDFDGWVLHTGSVNLSEILPLVPTGAPVRVGAWVKGFAAFKRNVPVAYAWEPVLVRPAREQTCGRAVKDALGFVSRDWIECPITLKRGLSGAKPEKVVWWALHFVGARPGDQIVDLYPGTGAVSAASLSWACAVSRTPRSPLDLFAEVQP